MRGTLAYLLALAVFVTAVLGASPTSFCKCTCFTNSTIIPLTSIKTTTPSNSNSDSSSLSSSSPFSSSDSSSSSPSDILKPRTCADCNRQFCLDYNLPICKDVKEETDVFATCFQRDSFKDEAVVYLFIVGTVGLVVWAVAGPVVEKWTEKIRGRHSYGPVPAGGR